MRAPLLAGIASLVALGGCGLENWFSNTFHTPYLRPASIIRGSAPPGATTVAQIWVTDGAGNTLGTFQSALEHGAYELRLPSSKYSMLKVNARVGDMLVRAIVPFVGEESTVEGVDLDAAGTTEALIAEAALSAKSIGLRLVTPAVYTATRARIRADMGAAGATQDLRLMVERFMARNDPSISSVDPAWFRIPAYDATYGLRTGSACGLGSGVPCSAIDAGWMSRNPFDYDGVAGAELDSSKFDTKLGQVAQLYKPEGCPDPTNIRVVFTVDFNQGAKNGTCGSIDRFKWATDKPGKSMFFVGWVYTGGGGGIAPSDINTPEAANALGNSTPNIIRMYDDGTNGDEVSGDNVWTVTVDLPRSHPPAPVMRVGYKYTWGTFGAVWTGSEEWPGNGRILEVVDVNGDGLVYRRDVFGDEATNKDFANLNPASNGHIDWTTDMHGCGPESHEQKFTLHDACTCGTEWFVPTAVGALTVACP